jgi:hypothetical protein
MPVFCESGATEGKRFNRNRTTALRRENATFAGKPFSWKYRHSDERRPHAPFIDPFTAPTSIASIKNAKIMDRKEKIGIPSTNKAENVDRKGFAGRSRRMTVAGIRRSSRRMTKKGR